ncbi:acetyl-CoA carboxylase, carboxyltransferase subunit beta [Clostridium estertheticum]|uniref:Acetyl-coenzyme A carboxylase carboxyl transferase subunit beta n=1 Tax=Clostridium estertheticum TaxID=238834 RepID=A0AA47EGT4_9CLOT|nr:acetyl-CoA carboxylase, carboxyltransferase subunit beta [Clostridium estertheticum]MBU3156297.1 acetyl-CoA carboxylase, carboxyltransferase subunit beta [Clostridium estertheticum]MBU3177095.1 acetyl-CoA carboxylase, carboxyltransferase subunit beta [Clostridium estertheticum]MBU3200800.1 acetyl-CoA carboxylase, carboxyltransferase subunit beta [Clostridium estertheticum]WAG59805.1 acetyl-CoA carboxylase, carboxyltransferase subunit beta [Clostridium estertheticum]WAG66124.1 acetyl-CoA car
MFEFKRIFKKSKYIEVKNLENEDGDKKPNIPSGMWVKCETCGKILYKKDLESSIMTCDNCKTHFRIGCRERIDYTIDKGTFKEYDEFMISDNPIDFKGYTEKLQTIRDKTLLNEAVITGEGKINGQDTLIAVMDSNFMMGSMGSVVGEKITRVIEKATESKKPIIIFTASGGARMQEGIFSLMQMAKTSAAIARHNESGNLYITVLTDPTTGGVTASFATLGDIILAEPNALIGFAGKRVIEQTLKQQLPEGFQRAEFLLEKGFIDKIVDRKVMKETLAQILKLHL